ncbi:hypothetical protein CHU92_00275 [Flavobacterium cyanobacteriorum]|uniref:DUF4265 domain-containing protein n=1 Tax=Flavobacterium cyanobacteriorum TaxID=2022802 RepID=A0A256A7M2_9FLAO|nr:DUF4265 domain-containing protein [Flavobacterium cyanobacteriorum]OYQ49732.1 hypothetical protein CHU92_00275 [Flavobacterium cyanobacteriorum]
MDDKYVKILFRFYSDVLEDWTVETMWAEIVNLEEGLYKLDNIPFFASVSSEDIVYAEFDDDDEMLTYSKTVVHSGNSTIQVVIMDENIATEELRVLFNSLGCDSEKFNEKYFVIEVSQRVNYNPIREKLIELEKQGIIGYAESNLAENHCY